MDDTHAAAEEDEGEEGHIHRAQSSAIPNSLTHNLASEQGGLPALVKGEPGLELTSVALHQHVCSSGTLEEGSVENQRKAKGATKTIGSHADAKSVYKRSMVASEPHRTIITKTPKYHFENGPMSPADMTVPLKRIKVEQPWMWITEQASTQLCDDDDELCKDPLSMLAAVVCLSVTERKGLEEKPFSPRASILRSIKTEPPDLHCVKKEPEDFKNDSCQKSTPGSPQWASPAVKHESPPSVLLPSVQSLAEKRNLSFDQAIAIEALTQLAAIPQRTQRSIKAESMCENPISNAAPYFPAPTNTPLQVVKPTAGVHSNKVSVISSPRQQTSVICPPVARQGNVIKCSQGFGSHAKTVHLEHPNASSDHDKTPCKRAEQGFGSPVVKSECSYKDLSEMNFRKDCDRVFREETYRVPAKDRNKDEVEVAAQLADLAFIIQSRHNQHSENSPPKGTPVSTIKYNYNFQLTPSQKKNYTKKTKPIPSKPRKKKNEGLHEGLNCRMPLSKRMPNGEAGHKGRGKKVLTQGKSSFHHKKNLFLPLTQIDLQKYRAGAQEERKHLTQQTPFMDHQIQNHSIIRSTNGCQENAPWCLSNGPLNHHSPCNSRAAELGRECEKHLLSQVAQPCSRLHHGADLDSSPAGAASLSHGGGQTVLANGRSGAQPSPPPSQQSYYKLEQSGQVTVLSTATDGDVGHSAESTPSKNSISSFLESPMSFLDTPTKNLLNTPSKKVSDLPSCQCMGECLPSALTHLHNSQQVAAHRFSVVAVK